MLLAKQTGMGSAMAQDGQYVGEEGFCITFLRWRGCCVYSVGVQGCVAVVACDVDFCLELHSSDQASRA
jgi:hypothetical protein